MRGKGAKDRILERAGKLFYRCGYQAVGVNQIIEESQTAKASFYSHFPSKEKLCATWLACVNKQSQARHNKLLKEIDNPIKAVSKYFGDLKAMMIETDYRGCPFSNTATVVDERSEIVRNEIVDHQLFHREFFVELARLMCKGAKAVKLGNRLFILYSGARIECQTLRDTWPIDVATEFAVDLCKKAKG